VPGRRIEVFDTLLRDGAQGEGVVFSLEDKIKLVRALDELGVDYIEAGNPFSNPKDMELFNFITSKMRLSHAKLAAFGMTRRPFSEAAGDASLNAMANCGAGVVSLVGKASLFQVRSVLGVEPEENLNMIEDSVRFLVSRGKEVFFDAEHFFDGYLEDAEYAIAAVAAARRGGASRAILCDTNGGTLPEDIARTIEDVLKRTDIALGIHCHNDAGLSTAGALAAVRAGAVQVQGTINGYGERCGNANLCEVVPNLALKMGFETGVNLSLITGTARLVDEIANMHSDSRAPYVGRSAFAHKGGMHIDGMLKSAASFEHVDPALVGNSRRYLVSEVSGRSALMTRIKKIEPSLGRSSEETGEILSRIKNLEAMGYSFEDADGSLSLRILGALGRRPEFFRVLDFHVISRKPDGSADAQAYVKVAVGDQVEINAEEGDGPINALDKALRKALTRFYPVMNSMRLTDFKVRVVSEQGTASSVRVHIDSTDGVSVFSTVGVSTNVLEAGFIAMTDAIDCLLMKHISKKGAC
jgi:2-isopropylmalate synthase